jgi:hypothetical protein
VSRLNGLRNHRGQIVMLSLAIAAGALAAGCGADSAPSVERHVLRSDRVTTTTSAPVAAQIGDAVVVERGGEQHVRNG